ncbi:hypothetical protein FRX31_026997 [Thalictrum thalictroides]|uniref:Uncharacterized protein n=1 Tax=Thalictrum thalictroides TaxID=46969 RepID=A0A7J6VEA0_THATH|nr:hypothetical protein FRX31_026997 [Thalictrum thalictroides]
MLLVFLISIAAFTAIAEFLTVDLHGSLFLANPVFSMQYLANGPERNHTGEQIPKKKKEMASIQIYLASQRLKVDI